jgi:hypothetical protein
VSATGTFNQAHNKLTFSGELEKGANVITGTWQFIDSSDNKVPVV